MNYTYVLRCADGSLYTGWTNDLEKRLAAHNAGSGAKYTKSRRPVTLAYYELHESKTAAMQREAAIKKLPRQAKLQLIEEEFTPLSMAVENCPITVFAPPYQTNDVVYLLTHNDTAAAVYARLQKPKPILIAVGGFDWNTDLTPWQAPPLRQNQPPFAGGADHFLRKLTQQLMPAVETRLSLHAKNRGLCGYSLAGLFAVWALFQTDLFSRAASVSGSLWYDDFVPFVQTHSLCAVPARVDLSLGDREKRTKTPRMATNEACTLAVQQALAEKQVPVTFTSTPGGHFHEPEQRLADAISRLYARQEEPT